MTRLLVSFLLLFAAPALAQGGARLQDAAAAQGIFERDWVLMNWALKHHDRDDDQMMSAAEASAAAQAFRAIADGDGDGRITQQEYRNAREFILARD